MKRKIKFRAWDSVKNKMIFAPTDDHAPNASWILALPNEVPKMQFTGLKDKNGKETYEGDIILLEGKKYLVDWSDDNAGFAFRSQEPNHPNHDIIGGFHDCEEFEVIGNIYELEINF